MKKALKAEVVLAVVFAIQLIACGANEEPVGAPVLYAGGTLDVEDIDRRLLALPHAERSLFLEGGLESWLTLAEDIVLEEHLVHLAGELPAVEGESFRSQMLRAARALTVERQLDNWLGPLPGPSDEEIQTLYSSRPAAGEEQRMVLHFYRSRESRTNEVLRGELAQIRARAEAGEPFDWLAKELSDGQARHTDGRLGWISPGTLPKALDDIIFALEPGTISQALTTQDGGHLFLVETVIEAPEETFAEFGRRAKARLLKQRREEAINQLVSEAEGLAEPWVASPATALEAIQGNRFSEVLLRSRSAELEALALFRELRADLAGARIGLWDVRELLSLHWRNELLFEAYAERGADRQLFANWASDPALRPRGLQLMGELLLSKRVPVDELRATLDRDWRRFAGPVRFDFDHYRFPQRVPAAMLSLMTQLEQLVAAERMTKAEVAQSQHTPFEGATLDQVTFSTPELAPFITRCEVDTWTPPMRTRFGVEVAHLLSCAEPTKPTFGDVAPRVEWAYLQRHGQQLWADMRPSLLNDAEFEVDLKSLRQGVSRLSSADDAQ